MDIRREEDRFVAALDEGEATLEYSWKDDRTLDYESTFVPEEAREDGVGEELVTHALDWARNEGYRVIPSCSFVRHVIEENPEYESLTA